MNREQYLLTCLAEECAEVAHRASKAVRFGMNEVKQGTDTTNKELLSGEIGDLIGVLALLEKECGGGVLPAEDPCPRKAERVAKYYAYSQSLGLAV